MKFNWGTGIAIFLVLFLAAAAAFIIFAINQDVNLVHKDYYEKGVDYSEQMKTTSRSEVFQDKIQVNSAASGLLVTVDSTLATTIDSGKVILYRPSGKEFDIEMPLEKPGNSVEFPAENLIRGRYILKLHWYASGVKYEIEKTVNIQ
jgi:hypothetical protein